MYIIKPIENNLFLAAEKFTEEMLKNCDDEQTAEKYRLANEKLKKINKVIQSTHIIF